MLPELAEQWYRCGSKRRQRCGRRPRIPGECDGDLRESTVIEHCGNKRSQHIGLGGRMAGDGGPNEGVAVSREFAQHKRRGLRRPRGIEGLTGTYKWGHVRRS